MGEVDKPAPAPEPQGSEEYPTIQSAVDEWVEYWKRSEDQPQDIERMCPWGSVARAYLALRSEVDRLKQETAQWKHLHDSCHPSQVQLRAELAQARDERDQYAGKLVQQVAKTATERSARERAEQVIVEYGEWFKSLGGHRDHLTQDEPCAPCRVVAMSDAILAARAKEGGQR